MVYNVIQLGLHPEEVKSKCLRNAANHVTNYSNNTNDSCLLEFVAVYKNTGISYAPAYERGSNFLVKTPENRYSNIYINCIMK